MSRNTDSHFGQVPMKNIRRSSFKMPYSYKTTANTSEIIPIMTQEVLPGDTFKVHTASLARMLTPIAPVMDNAWMDTYFFFVPNRLVWEHWKEFMGENTTDAWTQQIQYTVPEIKIPSSGWKKGTLGEKLYGIQGRAGGKKINALYVRAYTLIFNEWFRNENITEPADLSKGDALTNGSNGTDYVVDMQKGGCLAKAVKYADYFTRALPEPQKGPDIYLPLGVSAPVIGSGQTVPTVGNGKTLGLIDSLPNPVGIGINSSGDILGSTSWYDKNIGDTSTQAVPISVTESLGVSMDSNSGLVTTIPSMTADLSSATAATINQLRQAFAVQRMYEIDARGGTRYTEILRAHFGVLSPDGRQQRPEYLGGKRIPVNITSVSDTTGGSAPLGTQGAYSVTIDNHDDFTKSFDEHGMIIGLAVIRTEHSYQQGLDRKFLRKNRTDYYWPSLSNIGEQYIKEAEIYATGTSSDDDAFGYQEAWAEYRYNNNKITGELNSDYTQSLDIWHYGDDYASAPTLSDAWIRETDVNVGRTLAIQNQDQFKLDFYFDITAVRPMPIYSIPSLTGWN